MNAGLWDRARAGMAAIAVLGACATADVRAAGVPDIACDQPLFDFGVLTTDSNITHRFTLQNRGGEVLKIERLRASCACAKTEISRYEIPPGGSGEVTVELALKGRLGKQDHPTFVMSNDPDTPRYRLDCRGEIRLDVEVRPGLVFYQHVFGDEVRPQELAIAGGNSNQVHVLGVETNDVPFCDVRLETVRPEYEYRMYVTPKVEALKEKRRLDGKLWVKTDHERYGRVEVPVTLVLEKEILAIPGELPVPELAPEQEPPVWSILVRSRRGKAFEIVRTEAPRPEIRVETRRRSPNEHILTITNLRGVKAADGQKFRIWVKKSSAEEDVLEIPIRLLPRPKR